MIAQRTGNPQWRKTSVLIRTDILTRAQEEKIDISGECNRALADLLGIDYRQQPIPVEQPLGPVIVAKEPVVPGVGAAGGAPGLRPVLNAEDPETPAHLLNLRRRPARPAGPGASGAVAETRGPAPGDLVPPPPAPAKNRKAPERGEGRSPRKKKGDDLIRQFLADMIERTGSGEGGGSRMGKDEMYQLFVRYCRTKRCGAVPEQRAFSVALKNRFVLTEERAADGSRYWANVSLK